MAEYQVIARRYRPQRFKEVLGQNAIVKTLKNAILSAHTAQAYLFSGSRGTGKTTTARILAKALNCPNRDAECEPCNNCSSCKEITDGNSLDVLEIDGASHRGIEDIRQINETAGYATASGMYKIYIIDEVHMLTKEAFNALLKTLEEPPDKVKFFFATTEPHKVPPTILSRCQRFNLNRIPNDLIVKKLAEIAEDMNTTIEEEALLLVANLAEGGLRDAESLLDQVFSVHEGSISAQDVASILGVVSRDVYFELDEAGKEGNLAKAFEIVNQVFSEGKDLLHFVEGLLDHFRNLVLVSVSGEKASYLNLSDAERLRYSQSAKLYSKEQCMTLLDYLVDIQQQVRFAPSIRIMLEAILLRIIRSHQRLPIEVLVKKLSDLQEKVARQPNLEPEAPPIAPPAKVLAAPVPVAPKKETIALKPPPKAAEPASPRKDTKQYDNLLQFAAVELEGKVEKR